MTNSRTSPLKKILQKNELMLVLLFFALFIGFSVTSRHFFQLGNIMSLFSQMVELGLLTLAMAASILSGGMDLSIAAMASLYTVLLSVFIGTMGMNMWLGILLVVLIAIVCGLLNGFLAGYLKVTPMLATLGTQSLFTGVAMVVSRGVTVSLPNTGFTLFGRYKLFGILPFQILIFIIAIGAAVLLFSYSRWGRRVYLVGKNFGVAKFAGINCEKTVLSVYAYSSLMAFLAALVITSRISSGRADVADAMLLQTTAAAVLGGISIKGGEGAIGGAMIGVAIFTIISNGMNMLNASQFLQQVIIGGILLLALVIRTLLNRKK